MIGERALDRNGAYRGRGKVGLKLRHILQDRLVHTMPELIREMRSVVTPEEAVQAFRQYSTANRRGVSDIPLTAQISKGIEQLIRRSVWRWKRDKRQGKSDLYSMLSFDTIESGWDEIQYTGFYCWNCGLKGNRRKEKLCTKCHKELDGNYE